jgi:DNA polymerase I-like protein with 3'-5' exonuclease and polymerase domains
MLELINADIDLHSWFAGKTKGLITEENDYDGSEESRVAVITICDDITLNHNKLRKNAKAANFGFPGGMAAKKFLDTQRGYGNLEITLEECEALRESWFECFPEMAEHMKPLSDVVTDYDRKRFENESIRLYQASNIMGVHRRKCTFCSACNYPFQSLAALGAKRALWAVWRDGRYAKSMVNFVHDELIFELPAETAADDVRIIQKIMEDAMKQVIPDVRIEAEGCLMECWDKNAKPVFDGFGNLTVWRPEAA